MQIHKIDLYINILKSINYYRKHKSNIIIYIYIYFMSPILLDLFYFLVYM